MMKAKLIIFLTFFSLLLVVPQYGFSQESNTKDKSLSRKQEKEQKKKAKEAAALADREKYAKMLQDKHYIFMANTLSGDAGVTFSVTPKFNFLKVDGESIIYQFAFDGIVGWNGIGGITLKGEAEHYKFDPGKNVNKPMSVNARMKANAHWGTPYFTLTVYGEGYADIIINIKSATLNMRGQVVEIEGSGVYEGTEMDVDQ
jgi:hypothetical protein